MNMQTAAKSSLIFTDVFSLERFADPRTAISYGEFYQLIRSSLIRSVCEEEILRGLGDRLTALAEYAHTFRDTHALNQISRLLVTLPPDYEAVGRYYQALFLHQFGQGDVRQAGHLLEQVADKGPVRYRSKAMLSMGSIFARIGDNRSALSLYTEAGRFASCTNTSDAYSTLGAQKMAAVIVALEGNHRGAVALLEDLFPLAQTMRSVSLHVYYDYLNALAVELCEVGRLEEARNISQIVISSPFAPAYPEWSETNDEIALRGRRASRFVVAISQWNPENENQVTSDTGNLVQLIAARRPDIAETPDTVASPAKQRASVVNLLEWKNEVNERRSILKDRQTRLKELKKLPTEDKIAEIWGRLGDEDVDDDLLCETLLLLEDYQPEENQGS